MKQRRPTIPISQWRIALNFEETSKVQNQKGTPAHGCSCESCEYWRLTYSSILPEQILEQLLRLGIGIDTPSDVYEHGEEEDGRAFRVIFHVVGKFLSGSEYYKYDELLDRNLLNYQILRDRPYFSIVVLPHSESYDVAPEYKKNKDGELITIDMRLSIP